MKNFFVRLIAWLGSGLLIMALVSTSPALAQGIFPVAPNVSVATCGSSSAVGGFVVGVIDIRNPACEAPPFAADFQTGSPNNWLAPMYHNEAFQSPTGLASDEWLAPNFGGEIFGITLDDQVNPDIYVTSTSNYNTIGSGRISKIDGTTGAISVFAILPNSGQGLGNIAFNRANKQLYVTNFEDGKIYNLDLSGSILGSYDPFAPDDGSPGFAPLDERIWGIQANHIDGRLYFGTWSQHGFVQVGTTPNRVFSVALDGSGAPISGTEILEVTAPPLAGKDHSNPISDISFSKTGDMLLAERTMTSDTSVLAHLARILSFTGGTQNWVSTGNQFEVGRLNFGSGRTNSSGGVDWTDCVEVDQCNPYDLVLTTADAMDCCSAPNNLYGVQVLPATGGNLLNSWLIDLDADTIGQDKARIGDVEVNRTCVVAQGGCTLTQGYWKNHNRFAKNPGQQIPWPIDEDTLLCGQTWLNILMTPAKGGNAFYILAHQWIAAQLNVADGASTSPEVDAALADAEALLNTCSISKSDKGAAVALADLLDQYNNGLIGPGRCDDVEDDSGGDS